MVIGSRLRARGNSGAQILLLVCRVSLSLKLEFMENQQKPGLLLYSDLPLLISWSSLASHFTPICLFPLGFAFQGCWHFRLLFAQNLLHRKLFFLRLPVPLCYRLIHKLPGFQQDVGSRLCEHPFHPKVSSRVLESLF